MFISVWRFITDGWSSVRRARLLYLVFTVGFIAMAVGGAIKEDALVIALGAMFAFLTGFIAAVAPKLAVLFGPREVES